MVKMSSFTQRETYSVIPNWNCDSCKAYSYYHLLLIAHAISFTVLVLFLVNLVFRIIDKFSVSIQKQFTLENVIVIGRIIVYGF